MPTNLSFDRRQHEPSFVSSLKAGKLNLTFVVPNKDGKETRYNVERKCETSTVVGKRETSLNYKVQGKDFDIVIVLSERFDRELGNSANLFIGIFKDGKNFDLGFDSDAFAFNGREHQKEMDVIRGIVTGDNTLSEIVKAVGTYLPVLHSMHLRFDKLEDGHNHDELTGYHDLIDRKHEELSKFKQMIEGRPINPDLLRS